MRRNSVRHVLADVAQEDASNDSTSAKRDTCQPDVLQALGIRPSAPNGTSMDDRRCDARQRCKLGRICKVESHKSLGLRDVQARLNCPLTNVCGESWGKSVDEDVVVDRIAD